MSRSVITAARLLRLRTTQKRMAASDVAKAQAQSASLDHIAARISSLQLALGFDAGMTNGNDLKAATEMALRLETAQRGLELPIAEAADNSAKTRHVSVAALDRHDRAAKRYSDAVQSAEADRAKRAEAVRSYRKPKPLIGDSQ